MKRETTQDLREQLLNSPEVRDRIARRAYEIFEHRGHAQGQELQDWVQAEDEILGRLLEEARPKQRAAVRGRKQKAAVPAVAKPKKAKRAASSRGTTTPKAKEGVGVGTTPAGKRVAKGKSAKRPSVRSAKAAASVKSAKPGPPEAALASPQQKTEAATSTISRKNSAAAASERGSRRSQQKASVES